MIKKIIAAAALAACAASAFAAESDPFYAGIDFGSTKLGSNVSGHRNSYGMFGGYNINSNFAVEAGFRRLYSWDMYDGVGMGIKNANQASLSVIESVPLNDKFSVYGRLGVSHVWSRYTRDDFNYRSDSTGPLVGLGASYKFNDKVSARMELQPSNKGLNNMSVGVSYGF